MTENSTPLEGKTIMWVEDDVFLSDLIARKCVANKCKLYHAKSSPETFAQLEANESPDIIVLDILLPGENGYEILKKLKAEEKYKKIPVIILSNFGQKDEVQKGLDLGAEKFLIKATLTLDEIFREIDNIIKKYNSK